MNTATSSSILGLKQMAAQRGKTKGGAKGAAPVEDARSVVREAREIALATDMIGLGARLQVLLTETSLSRERLSRLYREIRHESPPKGMLPFSVDWHMTWLPNIHSSVFYNIYQFMVGDAGLRGPAALVEAYRGYQDLMGEEGTPEQGLVLSFTRAWMMVRFFEADMLQMCQCSRCGGQFVHHAHEPAENFVCGLCRLPPRAGKRLSATRSTRRRQTKAALSG